MKLFTPPYLFTYILNHYTPANLTTRENTIYIRHKHIVYVYERKLYVGAANNSRALKRRVVLHLRLSTTEFKICLIATNRLWVIYYRIYTRE